MIKETKKPDHFSKDDVSWMKKALALAARGAGHVSPNPMVGCVIVGENGKIVSSGHHERFGGAHAEINALNKVKDAGSLINATMYVTLEPCSHHGKTPPCADAIAKLPIGRVVVAMTDPNPKVNGKGIQALRSAGKRVDTGLLEPEARKLNEAFIHYIRFGKPFVTMKIAQTLDGYIAAPDGSSRWITGEAARERVHLWRSHYDAVMIGRNTAMTDNPRLTVRHVEGRQPKRIVIDGPYSLDKALHLFTDQYQDKTIIITHNKKAFRDIADPMLALISGKGSGVQTLLVDAKNGHTDLNEAFNEIGRLGIASVLVEPGSGLASALIRENLVDKLELFIAPKILGGGTRSILGTGLDTIQEAISLNDISLEKIGSDILVTGYF